MSANNIWGLFGPRREEVTEQQKKLHYGRLSK